MQPKPLLTPTVLISLSLFLTLSVSLATSPTSFTWSNFNGTSFVPEVHNQNMPAPCSSGWALSAVDVFNSRMKIRREGASPDFEISSQVLLSCDQYDYGCMGGEPLSAFKWIKRNNITDSSCQNYLAKGYTNGIGCTSQIKCQTCTSGTCKATQHSKIYSINDYGTVAGQSNIEQEILNYGPVACSINSNGLNNYNDGIIRFTTKDDFKINHHVFVYGWGEENGTKFWNCKNSWGSAWGEKGHFRIEKGKNAFGIESRCYWGSPLDTWTNDTRNNTIPNVAAKSAVQYDIPSYLTPIRSLATPHQCDASWAFAVVQMIADRHSKNTTGKEVIRLSVQALINCGVGKCSKGGSPIDALLFIEKYGLPDESCQNYAAADPSKQSCSGVGNCGSCTGSVFDYKCVETKNYKRWKVSDYSYLSGASSMKNQLNNGPIVCGLYASDNFKKYNGGVFSQVSVIPKVDTYVEIIGFGSQGSNNYWLGRNFWGTAWGESGFFRIKMGSDNLGIETKCYMSKGFV